MRETTILPPDAARLLEAWETGRGLTPGARALTLLGAACPDVDAGRLARLTVGQRDRALLTLRARLFGTGLECLTECPGCGERVELAFSTDQIGGGGELPSPALEGRPATVRTVESDGWNATWRVPTAGDLASLAPDANPDEARRTLQVACTLSAHAPDGTPVEPGDLPETLWDSIEARITEDDPDAETHLAVGCPSCDRSWSAPFDVVDFLWTEIDALARRLLQEVHRLARAYGWSEPQILALSPARRRAYLELVSPADL